MGIDDLRTVIEVRFEPIVVRRIVAGGEHHTRVCSEFAHRERELWRRARAVKKIRIAAEIRAGLCTKNGEIT